MIIHRSAQESVHIMSNTFFIHALRQLLRNVAAEALPLSPKELTVSGSFLSDPWDKVFLPPLSCTRSECDSQKHCCVGSTAPGWEYRDIHLFLDQTRTISEQVSREAQGHWGWEMEGKEIDGLQHRWSNSQLYKFVVGKSRDN